MKINNNIKLAITHSPLLLFILCRLKQFISNGKAMRKWSLLFYLFIFSIAKVVAQTYPRPEIDVEKFVEDLFNMQDEEANYEDLYEQLLIYYSDPVDLNQATRDDLLSLYVLSTEQINRFFEYKAKNGKLLSIYELQAIPDFDIQTIRKLLPFVIVQDDGIAIDNRPIWKRVLTEPNNYLLMRYERTLEEKKGYTAPTFNSRGEPSQRYMGDPNKFMTRFKTSHTGDFSAGFTAEKDAGEQFAWSPTTRRYGMDFWSAHFMLENRGRWKKIVIGDYQWQFGQSLVTAAGFAIGKGAEPIATVRRNNLGLRPYSSVLEGLFYRGAAATYQMGRIEITGMLSRKRIDGRIQDAEAIADSLTGENEQTSFASSLPITGFHRTPSELATKHTIIEEIAGASALYRSKNRKLETGILWQGLRYSVPFIRADQVYNQFDFRGQTNQNISISLGYVWQNFNFFGEAARSQSGGVAAIGGFMASLSPKIEMSMVARSYDANFHAFYGNGFGENTRNANERGVYWGLKYKPKKQWTFAGYYDMFRTPWLAFLADAPRIGTDYLVRATYQPTKKITMFVQARSKNREQNQRNVDNVSFNFITPTTRSTYAFQLDYRAEKWIQLKSRVQGGTFRQADGGGTSIGYAVMQDLNIDAANWEFSTRFALFQTDDFDTRQFAYERNVLYAFSIPAYFGRGSRMYFLTRYKFSKKTSIWARIARTHYRDRDRIGSGLEQINGNQRTDITIQFMHRF
jgi:hypothetical protein